MLLASLHADRELDKVEFLRPREKRETMLVNLRNIFTRIDRLRDTTIALPESREYRIVSRHDPGLVSIDLSTLGGTMRIRDPERFWSASGWLIVVYD